MREVDSERSKWRLYSDGKEYVLYVPTDRGSARARLSAAEIRGYESEGAGYISGIAARFANHPEALRARAENTARSRVARRQRR